jgi:hypothetical protein
LFTRALTFQEQPAQSVNTGDINNNQLSDIPPLNSRPNVAMDTTALPSYRDSSGIFPYRQGHE